MAVRPIPDGSTEIQTGLWASKRWRTNFQGEQVFSYELYSADGYCFWWRGNPNDYDEDGNLKPLEERVFYQYAYTTYTTIDELNVIYVSVPVQDGYEIVSVGGETVTE